MFQAQDPSWTLAVVAEICFVFNAANYAKYTNPEPFKIPLGLEDSTSEKHLLCCFPCCGSSSPWCTQSRTVALGKAPPGAWAAEESLPAFSLCLSAFSRGLRGSLVHNMNLDLALI